MCIVSIIFFLAGFLPYSLLISLSDRRSTYNHLSSWLTDARNLTNPNTVRDAHILHSTHYSRLNVAGVRNQN